MAQRRSPAGLRIEARVEAGDWPPARSLLALARRTVDAARRHGIAIPAKGWLSILFTDDAHMAALNANWRGLRKATNVLSFPASSKDHGFEPFLGDIALAFETIWRESREQGLKFEDHLTHLVLHGFLHLIGYDHVNNDEAERMESLETAILGGLQIKDPHRGRGT